MKKVFVSYKRADKDKVFPLVYNLESQLGIEFWVDLDGIRGDDYFDNVIMNAINECEVFLFMYSKSHGKINPNKDWTVREINFADVKQKRIVFVNLDGAELTDWFLFHFPHKQVTQANDIIAKGHLVEDIREWLRLPQPNLSPSHSEKTTEKVSIPTENSSHPQTEKTTTVKPHPQAIDLGLPSGTKWASCNVGATKPEEYGTYYAWGETEGKSYYDWSTYTHCNGKGNSCVDLGSSISGTPYDIAYIRWGNIWQMPTFDQFKELFDYCHNKWSTLNGIKGRKFTSNLNGNSIFLPAVGYRWKENLCYSGDNGFYWSSTQRQSLLEYAYYLYFGSSNVDWGCNCGSRFYGLMVRPVSRI